MGAGGGAQSCACGGCRWVTHPHRSLLHQFWWGKAPLIGFVEMICLPGGREGMRLTASRAAPYPGGCLLRAKPAAAGCLPSPRSARPPAHRAALPAAARECASRLNQWQRRHHAGSGGQAVPTATSTVPPLSFSRCSCFANRRGNDALRGRLRLQVTPRARAAAGWKRGQVEPFRLRTRLAGKRKPRPSTTIPLDPASPGGKRAAIGFGQSQTRGSRVRIGIMVLLGIRATLLAARLDRVRSRTQPYWVGDCTLLDAGGRAGSRLASTFEPFSASVGAPSRSETRGCAVDPQPSPALAVAAGCQRQPTPHRPTLP